MSIIYKQKEAKYTKPFEYFISMRNKELGLVEPELENSDHDSSSDRLQPEPELTAPETFASIEAEHLEEDLALTSEQFEGIWSELDEG